jgi:hypothetical protein
LYKFAALKYFLEQPDNLKTVKLQTTSARRRKPSSDTKYVPPPTKGREEDISDNDNYPEEFKQKLKGGVSKVKCSPAPDTPFSRLRRVSGDC